MAKTAREVFDLYATKANIPGLRGVRGTYAFDIDQVGNWFVSVNDCAIKVEEAKRDADCTIRCDERDFVDIIEGRRNLLTSAMQRRVQVRGDVALAQKFHGLVSSTLEEQRGAA